MEVKELTFKGSEKTVLYACGACGLLHSPTIYACDSEKAHATAHRFAEDCCKPKVCECGVELGKSHYTACEKCRERKRLEAAQVVKAEDYHGVVQSETNSGDWGEGYFSDLGEISEHCHGHDETEPAYVFTCTEKLLQIDPESILLNAADDMHEDAHDQIEAADELFAFIKEWNTKQHCKTYYPNWKQVIILDQARFDAVLKQPTYPI
ncbi:hypothetical protein [Pseudovibrio sp. Ad26]|uniref:hypothetical protein n=1 Tax=Pseudovibrio sp. Ad26 TaxID=989410 RepID=UPI0007AED145|nr:hypothetical protein [Pseudovibrio sp. Ad26]KZK99182.1 hypothetical protein PsAD26_04991 [Pseudovibrio sp. Ad26]